MKILLTGGTGFIGSHLLAMLVKSEHEVIALRRPGSETLIKLEQEPVWLERSLEDLTKSDLSEVEVVIHLASVGVSPQEASWQELEQVNVRAGLQLIQLAHQAGVKRFVAGGTCLEYGSEADEWERIPPKAALRPTTPYGASKAAGFLLLNAYAINNPIEFFYGRIFTAYGEGQFSKNLWPSLQKAALTGADFIMTKGTQIRDFISADKVSKHLFLAAERSDMQLYKPFVVNIGTGEGMSVADFASLQWRHFGATGSLVFGGMPDRPHDSIRIVADPCNLDFPSNV